MQRQDVFQSCFNLCWKCACWIHTSPTSSPSALCDFCNALVCVGWRGAQKKKIPKWGRATRTGKRQWQNTHGSIRFGEEEEEKTCFKRNNPSRPITPSIDIRTSCDGFKRKACDVKRAMTFGCRAGTSRQTPQDKKKERKPTRWRRITQLVGKGLLAG